MNVKNTVEEMCVKCIITIAYITYTHYVCQFDAINAGIGRYGGEVR